MEKNDISEEEVATPVLKDIEVLFKKSFSLAQKVFFGTIDFVRLLLNFALKKVIILIVAAALGGAFAYFSNLYFGKKYESSLILKSNVNTWEQLVGDVHYFNSLITEGQITTLSKTLNISEREAATLSSIEVEPSATYAQKIGLIEMLNKSADSLTLKNVDQKKLMKMDDMAFTENYNVSVSATDGFIFPEIEKSLISFFESSIAVQDKLERKRARVQSELTSYRKKLVDLDTLQRVLNRAIIENARSGGKQVTSISMDSEMNNSALSPIDVSDKYLAYTQKIVQLEERLSKMQSSYEIVSHFSKFGREKGLSKLSTIAWYSLYTLLGAYLLLLLYYFIKKKPLDA